MSRRFGLGDTTWQRLELEDRVPKGEVLAELIAMGFSVDWLITGVGAMRQEALPPQPHATATDHRLIGRLTEGMSRIFKEEGQAAALHQIAERAAQYHDRIVATVNDAEDRLLAAGELLGELRQELRRAAEKPNESKRLA